MKTNVERIVDFLERLNIDPAVFEKVAGLGNAAVKNNLKNKGKFSDKSLEKILNAYPILRKEWLYFGTGEMLYNDESVMHQINAVNSLKKNIDSVIAELTATNKALQEEKDTLKDKLLMQHEKYQTLKDAYDELKAKYDSLINKTGT